MFTSESFCNAVWGVPYSKMPSYTKENYKEFQIPKKNGVRTISYLEKETTLFDLQTKLLHGFLEKQALPTCVKGFVKGENYKTYLSPHIGSKYFLRVDIDSFFPSITEETVKTEIKNYLSLPKDDEETISGLIGDLVTRNGMLPQGAVTSPAVSNLIMARIDQRILKYCQVFDICYTRYADDLLFSSKTFDFSEKKWFLKKIKCILKDSGFRLNYSKMKLGCGEIALNGFVISAEEVRLSRSRLSDIRRVSTFMKRNYQLIREGNKGEFLGKANELQLQHRDLGQYPFKSVFQVVQYACGYRAFLLLWLDPISTTVFQKELSRLIRKTEQAIIACT